MWGAWLALKEAVMELSKRVEIYRLYGEFLDF